MPFLPSYSTGRYLKLFNWNIFYDKHFVIAELMIRDNTFYASFANKIVWNGFVFLTCIWRITIFLAEILTDFHLLLIRLD